MNTQLLHYVNYSYEEVVLFFFLPGTAACCFTCLFTYTTLNESSASEFSTYTSRKPNFARLRLNAVNSFLMVILIDLPVYNYCIVAA